MARQPSARNRTAKHRAKRPTALSAFRPLQANPNAHTQQGMGQLDAAMSRHGYVAPMTAAADGSVLDGNARLEIVATKFPGLAPLVVEHDGTRPIVMVRTDIKDANDPLARDIIVSANRIAEVDLAYDVNVLREFARDGLDLTPYEFDASTLKEIAVGTGGYENEQTRDSIAAMTVAQPTSIAWVLLGIPLREWPKHQAAIESLVGTAMFTSMVVRPDDKDKKASGVLNRSTTRRSRRRLRFAAGF